MRNIEFVTGEHYHLYNRGVDRRTIFETFGDFRRFYESIYLFNDANYSHAGGDILNKFVLLSGQKVFSLDRDPFVKIILFCLMPNHYHLLVQQLKDGGISQYMHKLKGYSRYFNLINERSGTLYEGGFKAKHVDSNEYFQHLALYIHSNPLDLVGIDWKNGQVSNWSKAIDFLNHYRWSSHHAWIQNDQLYPIIDQTYFGIFFDNMDQYVQALKGWMGRDLVDEIESVTR